MEGVDSLIECKASFALKILAVANGWLVRNFVVSFAPEAQQGDGIFTTFPLDAPESLRSSRLEMLRPFLVSLFFTSSWSSILHSAHSEDEASGPVMRREHLLKAEHRNEEEEALTSTVKAVDPLDSDSTAKPYRVSVSIHLPATTTTSTTTTTTAATRGTTVLLETTSVDLENLAETAKVAAEEAAQAAAEAKWRARLVVSEEKPEAAPEAMDIPVPEVFKVPSEIPSETVSTVSSVPGTVAIPIAITATPSVSSVPMPVAGESSVESVPSAVPFVETTEATTFSTTQETQYSRKYVTTSRRTMTIEVTTETTSAATAHVTAAPAHSATIPLKIPSHMHPVVAPPSNFPEELSAASWKSLQAQKTSTTRPAMSVEDSMEEAAKVAQVAAQRAGASEEDAAVEAAKAAEWMRQHELSEGHTTTSKATVSSTSSWMTYVIGDSKDDAIEEIGNEYAAAARTVQQKYAPVPFSPNRTAKVIKELNLTGRPMRVRVVTSEGDIVTTEAPEEEVGTSQAPPGWNEMKNMDEMIDEVVLKDLPKLVAGVAAKISHRSMESEIPKATSKMVVKLLVETPLKDVPDAIIEMLVELVNRVAPSASNPVSIVRSALEEILEDYRVPEKEDVTKVVDQTVDSAEASEEAKAAAKAEAEAPQSEKVMKVITDVADKLAKKNEGPVDSEGGDQVEEQEDVTSTEAESQEEDIETTPNGPSIASGDESESIMGDSDEGNNATNATVGDGEPINSAEVLPDEDQAYTAAEMMKNAKERKGSDVPNQRPIAVHSVHSSYGDHSSGRNVVKAVQHAGEKHEGEDSDSDEEDLEVESPAKSGGKVLVGLTVFLGGLLMVVAISSAAYMAYQRSQAQQRPLTQASPAAAAAPSQAAAAPSGAPPEAAAEPTFTGGPGGPEAGG